MLQSVCFRRSCNRLILEADRDKRNQTLAERGGSMKRRKHSQQTDESPGRTKGQGREGGLSATRSTTADPTAQIDKDNTVSDTKRETDMQFRHAKVRITWQHPSTESQHLHR